MAEFDAPLNEDVNDKLTSARWNETDSRWEMDVVIVEGDPSSTAVATGVGAPADAAVTNPTSSGSIIALLKGLLTNLRVHATGLMKLEDAAHASGDAGIAVWAVRKDTAAVSSDTTGDYEPFQTDSSGRLRTLAKRDPTDALSLVHMAAAANAQIVKASAGTLHSIVGYIVSGEDGWLQVHDAVSAPAESAVPELTVPFFASAQAQPVNIPLPGHVCGTGITLVWSLTGPTKTIGAAKMMVVAYYE